MGDALDRYGRFYGMMTDGLRMELSVKGSMAQIELTEADPSLDPQHFLIEWYATRLYGFSQWLIGREIPQIEIEFAHARQLPMGAYMDVMGKRVAFDCPANRLIMPRHLLDRRVIRDIDDLSALASAEFDPEHRSYARGSWSKRIKVALRSSLHEMAALPTMEDLARQFAVSSQTLRRGLRMEGTSYREVKAEARREVVETTISDTSLTLSQISVLAGFAETNGLVRAMKSWTGQSLSAFRRAAIESANDPSEADDPDGRQT